MNYHQIIISDTANGTGLRVSLFVSGCRNNCPECHNKAGQNFNFGKPFTQETIEEILNQFRMVPVYDGLTILGGDPMEPENTYEVYALIRRFKTEFPDKTVWLYTGYNFEDLIEGGKRMTTETEGVIQNCDVIVDGRFDIKLKDVRLNYRGSSNQRIIDVKESLKKKEVVTLDL